ncbi:MAG: hypothetical protein Q8J59_11660 [Methylotenera sp.]|nr:hypothetical protein [Methylotenera sp.]MDP2282327.1 hypothetical protein [Methylotenera sp.]MDP3061431.1 hypothetical protein [Methylotenera sp.]
MWRIDWFGEFYYPPGNSNSQPSVRIAISPVLCDSADPDAMLAATATNLDNQRQISLKVGLLNLVKIGDVWQNGQCICTPDYQTERFEKLSVNKTTVNIIKAGLPISGEFILPLDEHPWHRLQTMSYCLSVVLPNKKRMIIPCVELIRFYFGSSSKFLHLLFTRQITPEYFLKSSHFNNNSGHLHLKLAESLSGMSATDIGRIILDDNAWRAARLIFDTSMAASAAHEPIYPFTRFPFIGETDLVCTGKWLSNGATPDSTFVVYQLKSCSHPFPFKSLSYEMADNTKAAAKKSDATNQSPESSNKNVILNKENIATQTMVDTDPGKSKSSIESWVKGSPRFPDLLKKSVWRERYDTIDPPAVLLIKGPATDEQVGVGDGRSSNNETRSIDVGHGFDRSKLSGIDQKQHKFVFDGVKIAIKQLKLRTNIMNTGLITLPGYTHPVISLPYLVDEHAEINPISLCDDGHGGTRMRRGCFVEITGSKTSYRFFIVERQNIKDVVLAVNIRNFELLYAMEALIAYSKNKLSRSNQQKENKKPSFSLLNKVTNGIIQLFGKLKL